MSGYLIALFDERTLVGHLSLIRLQIHHSLALNTSLFQPRFFFINSLLLLSLTTLRIEIMFPCFFKLSKLSYLIPTFLSSSNKPELSNGELSGGYSLEVPLICQRRSSSSKTRPTVEAPPPSTKPSLCLDFPRQQRSYLTSADEKVLQHNYEIPPFIQLHFA